MDLPGTCTLAILMRVEARPGDLPGEDDRSTITNDVSSFRTLGYVASKIYDMCGKPLKSPGWATVGEYAQSIRVGVGREAG